MAMKNNLIIILLATGLLCAAGRSTALDASDHDEIIPYALVGGFFLGIPACAVSSAGNIAYLRQDDPNIGSGIIGVAVGIPTTVFGIYISYLGVSANVGAATWAGAALASVGAVTTTIGTLNIIHDVDASDDSTNPIAILPFMKRDSFGGASYGIRLLMGL